MVRIPFLSLDVSPEISLFPGEYLKGRFRKVSGLSAWPEEVGCFVKRNGNEQVSREVAEGSERSGAGAREKPGCGCYLHACLPARAPSSAPHQVFPLLINIPVTVKPGY